MQSFKLIAFVAVALSLPQLTFGCGAETCMRPMSAKEIQTLPVSVAQEFRQLSKYQRYQENSDAWLAVGSNCASFALNKWGDHSYSGDYEADVRALIVTRSPCNTFVDRLKRNPRLGAYTASAGDCSRGGYLVVPFVRVNWKVGSFSFNTHTHLVRQMPNGRFAHIDGPDGLIGWITRRDDSGAYSPVTTISQLIPFQDFEPCPAVCVTTTATVGIAGTYRGPLGEITFRSDGTYVLDAFGQRASSNYKIEGDRVFLNNPVTGKAPWYVLRAPCLHEPTIGGELFCQGREPR